MADDFGTTKGLRSLHFRALVAQYENRLRRGIVAESWKKEILRRLEHGEETEIMVRRARLELGLRNSMPRRKSNG